MDPQFLRTELQRLEPLILSGPKESLRVVGKTGRRVCDVRFGDQADVPTVVRQVGDHLNTPVSFGDELPLRLRVNVVSEALAVDGVCDAIVCLAEFLGSRSRVELLLHLAEGFSEWRSVLGKIRVVRRLLARPGDLSICIIGRLSTVSQQEMELLFELGIRVAFKCDHFSHRGEMDSLGCDLDALRRFSRFGFRAVVVCYVHADNVTDVADSLPTLLSANNYSGFALPLVSSSPYYVFGDGGPALPDSLGYCQLLASAYRQYPHYDDVLSPLSDLALLIRNGGWHSQFDLPVAMQLLVESDGRVGIYRQSPAFAAPWTCIADVASGHAEWLRNRFLWIAAEQWRRKTDSRCHECSWRHICGGLDAGTSLQIGTRELDSMCGYRRLFLEHFALLRAPDVVLETPQQL